MHRAGFLLFMAALVFGQDDLAVKSHTAKQAMVEGHFDQAARLYSELVKALPRNPGMLMNLGLAQHSAGRYREAIASFTAVLQLQPGLTQAKFLTGVAYLKLGEPAKAAGPLSDVVKAEPGNPMATLEFADALLSSGRSQEAIAQFRHLIRLEPGDARGWQGLGLSYLGAARESFSALEKAAPNSAYVLALLANSRAQEGNFRAAFSLYRQALAKDPRLRGAHSALSGIYRDSGHTEWSVIEESRERELPAPDCSVARAECAFIERLFEQALASGNAPQTLFWNSRSYTELALEAFAHLVRLPPSPQIHELLAEGYSVRGQHRAAAEELRQAIQLNPGNIRLKGLLAAALWRNRDLEAALSLLRKLVAMDPNSADLNFQLGDVLLQQEEAEKALPWLQAAVRINPRLLPARASLARALIKTGNPADAIPHLKAALPIDEDGSLHFQLGRAYERTGNPTLSSQAMRRFEAMSQARSKRTVLEEQLQITAP